MMTQTKTFEKIEWPHGNRCAVLLSFDVDGDTIWKNGNRDHPGGEGFIRSTSVGNYGPRRAVKRILDMLEELEIRSTFFVPAKVMEDHPKLFVEIDRRGHEIAHHGFHHERYVDLPIEEQQTIIEKSQAVFEKTLGKRAVGFRTPSGDWSKETVGLLHTMGFQYSSSMRGDDRPYTTVIDGEETDFVEIPSKWELDDFVALGYNLFPPDPAGQDRISGMENVFENFMQEFDGYYREGLCYVVQCHPQIIGTPGSLLMYRRLIEYIQGHEGVWIATGGEIARWWKERYLK